MSKTHILLICLCLCAIVVMPAMAFTTTSLAITLVPDGDARAEIHYDLSYVEQTAVFLRIADPAAELKKAFDANSPEPVSVIEATSSSAVIILPSFAAVSVKDRKKTMETPAVSFERAQKVLDQYWFAPLISPDLSPKVTTITFPDGYNVAFDDQLVIPPVSHTAAS